MNIVIIKLGSGRKIRRRVMERGAKENEKNTTIRRTEETHRISDSAGLLCNYVI